MAIPSAFAGRRVRLRAPRLTGAEAVFAAAASDPEVVGTCGWTRPRPHVVEIGYCLGRNWWRQGIMSEVVQVMIDEAQRDPSVYRLARYATFPNLGPEPRDCSLFAKAVK
jgi:ribosomal-protein-alanine N-acetyltransferase